MKKIHMVDVVSEYQKYSTEINSRIQNVLNSGVYIQGEEVKELENELSSYLNSKHTITCGNGTDALCLALMALNLKAGDEVLIPPFTFVSTIEAICLLGLKPVFVDIEPNTFLLNPSLIESSISNKTKVILPVHLFGQCCDMTSINIIAKKYNLFIVEDAAQSLGSQCLYQKNNNKMKYSGTIGQIGITSFYPSKNLGCYGDGGAVFSQNRQIAKKIKLLANHGQEKKYVHKIVGFNSRLDSLQAAILRFKLSILNATNQKRQNAANEYNNNLEFVNWIRIPKKGQHSKHIYHQYSILLSSRINRDKFQKYLLEFGIPSMIYYPIPLHKQKPYKVYSNKPLPVSEMISKQIISLPIHPELELKQIHFICDIIKKYI